MSRLTAALLITVVCALPMTHLNAAQVGGPPQVVVKVSPAEVVDIRLYTPAIDGTTIGTTNPQGTAMLDFLKIANAGKIGVKYTATTERCPDGDLILLNSDDGVLPPARPRCRRRGAGGFVLGYDAILNVKIGGPAVPPTWMLLTGAGAGVGLTALALSGEEPATNSTPNPNPNPGAGGTPTNPVNISALLGTYNINATKLTDTGCNFLPSFTGRLVLSGPSDGSQLTARMIERLERAYAGAMTAAGAYNGTGTGNLDGFIYNGTIVGQVGTGGTSVTGTETMNFTAGCPGRQVVYQFTGNK